MGAWFVLAAGKGWQEAVLGEAGEGEGRGLPRAPPNMQPRQLGPQPLCSQSAAIQALVPLPVWLCQRSGR